MYLCFLDRSFYSLCRLGSGLSASLCVFGLTALCVCVCVCVCVCECVSKPDY